MSAHPDLICIHPTDSGYLHHIPPIARDEQELHTLTRAMTRFSVGWLSRSHQFDGVVLCQSVHAEHSSEILVDLVCHSDEVGKRLMEEVERVLGRYCKRLTVHTLGDERMKTMYQSLGFFLVSEIALPTITSYIMKKIL